MEISTKEDKKKSSKRSYRFLRHILILLILISFVLYLPSFYLTTSDKVIRDCAAKSLNKNPNLFCWLDYSNVTKLDLSGKELFDLRYISKFKNLEYLSFDNIIASSPKKTPKWKKILQKYKIIKPKPQQDKNILMNTKDPQTGRSFTQYISQDELIDLSPLKKLKKLQSLNLSNKNSGKINAVLSLRKSPNLNSDDLYRNTTVPFKNIKPLSSLTTLKTLNLNNIHISNLEPIENLKNLQNLYLNQTDVIDLTPLRNLTNINSLFLNNTVITNLKPLKKLNNLNELWICGCINIKDKQVVDLQNTLPNLKIYRHLNTEE